MAFMKLVTLFLVTTRLKSLALSSMLMFPYLLRKLSHRLKRHKELQRLALNEPNSDEIFEHCLIVNCYPDRPTES